MKLVLFLLGFCCLAVSADAQCPPPPQCVHTCRLIVIRGPAGPQLVPYPVQVPVPAPVIVPQAAAPGPDPTTIALLQQVLAHHQQLLANQTSILSQLAALKANQAAPSPGCNGQGIIVVPADGGNPITVPSPTVPAAPTPASPTPGVTPPPFTLPSTPAAPIVLPGGATPPITLPGGSTPPISLPGGSTPPIVIPKGSSAPSMPPATLGAAPAATPQRYAVYTRYTMYEPAKKRYLYVFVPCRFQSTFVPAKKR